ncbi:MAG: GrpB family protein [Candidatus Bathyarchaeia archaeon]
MPRPVVIVDYDSRWPAIYEEEKHLILNKVGGRSLGIEHIGSTAVPGLGAKPIIDMMLGINGPTDAGELLPILREIGYTDVTPEPGDPEWYYCLGKKASTHNQLYFHLHLMKHLSKTWGRHLLFRNYLRTHPDTAQKYESLKRELAAKYGSDKAYTNAKTKFIADVIALQEV